MTRFFATSSFVTVLLLVAGWAHAGEPVCTVTERLVTTPSGEQHIVRRVVCVVSSEAGK